ncbi:hypothetical protein HK103_005026 [Boothiomyces macroporosus]|uniref:Uncharacterized protein n=1 Tax=Boothiomyces macroporosus TaxID=261099 RepID=A0AAD5UGB4_9FUNG|nr:hypothetical protein HK103_005026 [Boothiomyces macroporosus]
MSQDPDFLFAEAEKKSTQKGWFGGNKLDEAADLYGRAGNAYKLKREFKKSGEAFMKQGATHEKLGERDEASGCYINASKSYKKEFPKEAVEALKLAVMILTEKGRFSSAASNQKQIAEIYEQDIGDYTSAMEAYELAAEWYQGEDSNAQANACLLKVAQFAASAADYEKAVDIFEKVASKSLDNNLTKWSVREYLFKAMICVLCLNALVTACEESDAEAFSTALAEFDRMTKLDEWKTSLLLIVKKNIESDEVDIL